MNALTMKWFTITSGKCTLSLVHTDRTAGALQFIWLGDVLWLQASSRSSGFPCGVSSISRSLYNVKPYLAGNIPAQLRPNLEISKAKSAFVQRLGGGQNRLTKDRRRVYYCGKANQANDVLGLAFMCSPILSNRFFLSSLADPFHSNKLPLSGSTRWQHSALIIKLVIRRLPRLGPCGLALRGCLI